MRLLVTWGAERAKRFPEVPTLRENGIDIVTTSPYGIAGPKGMAAGVAQALHDPRHPAVLERMDMSVIYLNDADYLEEVRRTMAKEGPLAQRLGIRIN